MEWLTVCALARRSVSHGLSRPGQPPVAARAAPPTTISPSVNARATAWVVFAAPNLDRALSM